MNNRGVWVAVGIVAVGIVVGLLTLTGTKPAITAAGQSAEKVQHEEAEHFLGSGLAFCGSAR